MSVPTIMTGAEFVDDRGVLTYNNNCNMQMFGVKRTYLINGHRGFIRAWHGHKIESKLMQVVSGRVKVRLVNMENDQQQYSFCMKDNGDIVYIPAGFYNGLQHLTDNSSLLVYSNTTVEESQNDDYRQHWTQFDPPQWSLENYR
jgi:dTDP-4-dehydrorhamnose 3,5-epimerase-like enzyme